MPNSAPRFKGKTKREIANEAFHVLGVKATIQEIDGYFRKHYGLPHCERSMYCSAKRLAEGCPPPVRRSYRRNKEKDMTSLVARTRQLAHDMGGYDALQELINVLQ